MMAFQLKIQFSGLCLFAVEPPTDAEPARMHVLMPKAVGMHLHIPVLEFDAAHLIDPACYRACGKPEPKPSTLVAQLPLRGSGVDVLGSTLDTKICAEIVKVSEADAGQPVLPVVFKKQPQQPLLAARITLHAGRMTRVAPGVCWRWVGGTHRRMAHIAEWTVDVDDASLIWSLDDFAGNPLGREVELHPMNLLGEDLLNVRVRHLPAESLAVEPVPSNPGIVAEHFAHYYPLFGLASTPLLPREPVQMNCPPKDCEHMVFSGETAFNCMLGAG